MAGIRQHHIPKFLQKGFASHQDGENIFTWVFRKGHAPFNTDLSNVGVERFFYTEKNDSIADDIITEAEINYSKLIHNLRDNYSIGRIDDPLVPEFIAHLEVRTRHLRQNILESTDYLVDRLLAFISDDEQFYDLLQENIDNEDSYIFKIIIDGFIQNGVSKEIAETLIKSSPIIRTHILKSFKGTMPLIAKDMREKYSRKQIKNIVKQNHIQILKKSIAPDIRIGFYKKLNYKLVQVAEENLILGDSAILFATDGGKSFKTFTDKTDQIDGVFLPLTPDLILVGKSDSFEPKVKNISELIAANSLEYFISDKNDSETITLQRNIGREAAILSKSEINNLIVDVFAE